MTISELMRACEQQRIPDHNGVKVLIDGQAVPVRWVEQYYGKDNWVCLLIPDVADNRHYGK